MKWTSALKSKRFFEKRISTDLFLLFPKINLENHYIFNSPELQNIFAGLTIS